MAQPNTATADVHSVNHVGIAVRDLDETSRRYEQMGFQLTPFSAHSGAFRPGDPVAPLRGGNRCVMFAGNYLEILASEDPAAPSPRIEGFLRRHQGGHIICFGSDDLQATAHRCAEAGVATSGVIPLQRDVDTPEGVRTARFERMQFAPADSPEGYIQVARHLTPEVIYQPRYRVHPNGCDDLTTTWLVVDDVASFERRYAAFTGVEAVPVDGLPTFVFAQGSRLVLATSAQLVARLPGTLHPPVPGIAAVDFRCPDLPAQAARLGRHRIPFIRLGEHRLMVPAEVACGIAVSFCEPPGEAR